MVEDFTNFEIDWSTPQTLLDSAREIHRAASKAFKAGNLEAHRTLREKAEVAYNGLVSREYKDAFALVLLAVMDQERNYHGRSIALLQVAVAKLMNWLQKSPKDKEDIYKWLRDAYCTMAFCHRGEGRRTEAVKAFETALTYGPSDPEILSGFAGLYINDGNPQACIDLVNRAKAIAPNDIENHWNLALAHLELGHWKIGFDYYHKGVLGKERLNLNYWAQGKTPIWDGTPGQTIVVYGEQGVGDEIMFSSCLPEFIKDCKHVIFDCHPRLEKTFKRSFPGIEIFGTRKERALGWAEHRTDIEACVAIGSLPMFYRSKDADFKQYEDGYLRADPERVAHFRGILEALGPGPYGGLAWQGGVKKTRFDLRSVPLGKLAPVLALPVKWISLHYMPEAAKAAAKYDLIHWQEVIDDLDEMHALICACDFVVAVNQTLVHQAGALGKKAFVLTPARPAWRYGLEGRKMIWYPSVTQYRQRMEEEPNWEPTIGRLIEDLRIYMKNLNAPSNSGQRTQHNQIAAG